MTKHFQDYSRKPFPVQAARVDPSNIEELTEICGGKLMHDGEKEGNFSRDYIKVRVAFPLNEEQTKARIGDWLVKQGRTFKVYKDKPFRSTFENRDGTPVRSSHQQKQDKPSPANMPKKKPEGAREEQEAFAAEQIVKEQKMERDEILEAPTPPENKVAEAVEKVPSPEGPAHPEENPGVIANAKIVGANLVEGPPDPSRGVHPIEVENPPEEAPAEVDVTEEAPESEGTQVQPEKKPITLDELNERPGDPRTADDIHREGMQQG